MMLSLSSADETKQLGVKLGQILPARTTLVLTGDLGVGKTTLTQGIGEGLGIKQLVKSPTYTLIREYEDGRIPLYHMDVYRLEEAALDLGLEEYFEGDGLCVVEWGELIREELPNNYLELILTRTNSDKRQAQLIGHNMEVPKIELEEKKK